jgi:hypothetical protein
VRPTIGLFLVAALAGCGAAETTESKPDPVTSKQPLDSPPAEEGTAPPLGKPRAKVPPTAMDKRSESSLLHDTPPH